MKRIEFIAPVEAMRGNLSGTQKGLEYPTNNNAAYDAPIGRQYAGNYKPCFIGAKRASDGLKYFGVRTKTAFGMSLKSKKAMAVLGGAGAIVAAILRDKSASIYATAEAAYEAYEAQQSQKETFRKWLTRYIMKGLKAKDAVISVGQILFPGMGFTFNNPWVSGGSSSNNVSVTEGSLVKFWGELANDPVEFTIDGQKGIAHNGDEFDTVINSRYNVLNLSADADGHLMMSSLFVTYTSGSAAGTYVDPQDSISNGLVLALTDVEPEP